MFLIVITRRRRVACAAKDKWPGNVIPLFKNNPKELEKLDNLVNELSKTCRIPNVFEEDGIISHIMSSLHERRRNIKNGYNYENVRG